MGADVGRDVGAALGVPVGCGVGAPSANVGAGVGAGDGSPPAINSYVTLMPRTTKAKCCGALLGTLRAVTTGQTLSPLLGTNTTSRLLSGSGELRPFG